jgi:hypothetical protein
MRDKIYAYVQREAEYKNGDYQNWEPSLKSLLGSDTLKIERE